MGSQGAFVAGSELLRDWLWNRARSFVFSTGLAPVAAEAARQALELIEHSPDLQAKVARLALRLRDGVAALGHDLRVGGFGHVVPIVVGASDRAMQLAALVAEEGFVAPAIRPPTVPRGTARLRLTVTAAHDESDVDELVGAIHRAAERLR
jgi:8-amino-7-oxononanoate synthase